MKDIKSLEMVDIRTVEIVTPDLQRETLLRTNQKLKNVSYFLFSAIIVSITVFAIAQLNKRQNKKS